MDSAAGLCSATCLAVVRAADGVALVVLLAFIWWGARKGALRQALSLLVLAGALWAAGRHASVFDGTIAKLVDVTAAERLALGWAAVLFAVLVAAAILLRLLAHGLPTRSRGGVDRILGACLGAAKGALVLTIAGYALLALAPAGAGPALSRPSTPVSQAAPAPELAERVRGSISAACLEAWGGLLRRWLDVPGWVEQRVEAVNRQILAPPPEESPRVRPRVR